jgi:hypothetical protein
LFLGERTEIDACKDECHVKVRLVSRLTLDLAVDLEGDLALSALPALPHRTREEPTRLVDIPTVLEKKRFIQVEKVREIDRKVAECNSAFGGHMPRSLYHVLHMRVPYVMAIAAATSRVMATRELCIVE